MNPPLAIILAAGKGTRMESSLPKVLVPVLGRPMIRYVIEALRKAGVSRMLVVVGYRGEEVRQELSDEPGIAFVEQTEQLGTGHAVMVCREELAEQQGGVLVLTGDSPMTQASSLGGLLEEFEQTRPACLIGTAHKDDPQGLGRVVRDEEGQFVAIVEEKDCTPDQRRLTEVNMSTYVFDCRRLLAALERLTTENAQGEYYITDAPGILKKQGHAVRALAALEPCEALSINTLADLAAVEAELRRQTTS